MGNEKKRSLIEWGKNALIVLLALSALYLLGRTQLYVDGAASGGHLLSGLKSIFSEEEPVSPSQVLGDWSQGTLPRPVRMVVLTPQGSAGIQYDNTVLDSLFLEFTNPLADALTSAGTPQQVSEEAFRTALSAQRPGIYLDFLGRVPLTNLTAWLSGGRAGNVELPHSIRRMLLTLSEDGRVLLYFIDENTGNCYVSETASDLAQRLERFVAGVSPNGAAFAFQSGEAYASLAPYTLLGGGVSPQPDRFSVTNPVPITDGGEDYGDAFEALVRSLSFQPQSMSYRSRDGVTIQEGSEKLRFSDSGQVTYEAAERTDPRFPLQGLSQNPTEWELVGKCLGLCGTGFPDQFRLPAVRGRAAVYPGAGGDGGRRGRSHRLPAGRRRRGGGTAGLCRPNRDLRRRHHRLSAPAAQVHLCAAGTPGAAGAPGHRRTGGTGGPGLGAAALLL